MPWALGWDLALGDASVKKTFDVALHMGTLAAVVVFFAPELARLAAAAARSIRRRSLAAADARLAWLVVVATLPAAVLGAAFESFFEKAGQPWLIAIALAVFGLVMLVADRRPGPRLLEDLQLRDALAVGFAQALALVPGVSRSGATITAGVALSQTRATAARFSFLLSVPVIAGAGAYKGIDLLGHGFPPAIGPGAFAIGIAASAASGFVAVSGLIRMLQRTSLTSFVAYRILAALTALALIATPSRGATL